jgi:signal transduction histidine kinase
VGAAALTLLFTAQSVGFRVMEHSPANLPRALRTQAVFWGGWLLLMPALIWLARRRPIDPQRPATFAPWVGAALALVLLHGALTFEAGRLGGWIRPPPPPIPPEWYGIWVTAVGETPPSLMYVAVVVTAYHMAVFWREANQRRVAAAQLQARLAEVELDLLRIQLHPHFLFNALNTASSLMTHDVEAARTFLSELGDLLRLALAYLARGSVRVADELEFARRYLSIQQHRYGERLRVDVRCDEAVEEAWVPGLVLQPLVENAVRHGVEPRESGGRVWVEAVARDGRLRLSVRDDGAGPAGPVRDGVGLANTRERLRHLYGADQAFALGARPGGGCEAVVELPLRFTREVGS